MQHQYEEHKDCQIPCCIVCEGGLAICVSCGLTEGCLTTDCPQVECYAEKGNDVYIGKIDFRNGQWVEAITPHSPAYYREKSK